MQNLPKDMNIVKVYKNSPFQYDLNQNFRLNKVLLWSLTVLYIIDFLGDQINQYN